MDGAKGRRGVTVNRFWKVIWIGFCFDNFEPNKSIFPPRWLKKAETQQRPIQFVYSDQGLPNTAPKDTSKQPRHASSRPACHQDQMTPQGLWAAVFTSRMQSTLFLEYQEWQFFMLIKKKIIIINSVSRSSHCSKKFSCEYLLHAPKEASWLSTWDLAQELGAVQWQSGVQDSQVTLLQS